MRREAETEAAAMGVWGVGLYSGDFAMDLRSTIGMVARLPFETEKLVEIVRAQELAAANDSSDEDHTTFWLVMADQLRKKGLKSELAFSAALEIIDSNRDLEMMRDRGMSERDLKKRRTQLQHLRAQLLEPLPQTKRTIMKKPQPYVMDAGDVIVYPTCEGTPHQRRSLNEEGKLVIRSYMEPRWDKAPPWRRDGWSAFVVVERGRAFDFFAWYTPVVLMSAQTEKPTPDTLLSDNLEWEFARSGTCSAQKFQLSNSSASRTGKSTLKRCRLSTWHSMRLGTNVRANSVSIQNTLQDSLRTASREGLQR